MRLLLAISWRNLWRNRRRTLISMSAAGFGLALSIFYAGWMQGMTGEAKNELDNTGMGHVEVYAKDWRPRRPVEVALADPKGLLGQLELPAEAEVGSRIVVRALATGAHGAQGVTVLGVDPEQELKLSAHFSDLRQGERLAAADRRGVLVGEKLAEKLRIKVGQKLKLMVQGADGEMSADVFRVRGIFHSISAPLSRATVFINAPAAQKLLGLGEVAHQLVVQLPDAAQAEPLAAAIRARLGDQAEVVTFADLMPALVQIEKMMDKMILMITLFVYLLIGLGIMNTMLMSVLERTRELGVMRALGERPRGIVTLIVAESFWIALLSVASGLALGLALVWAGSDGSLLDFRGSMESWEMGGAVLNAQVRTAVAVGPTIKASILVFVLTTLIGIYPAWRISKVEPAKALRAN